MKKYISRMFNLQGLLVDKVECLDEQKLLVVHCRSPRTHARCPVCQSNTNKVHQYRYRKVKHDRLGEKQVVLRLKIRRFKCRQCPKTFSEAIAGIDRKRASQNFRLEVLSWLQRNSFRFIGQRFKISASTLNRYVLAVSDCWLIDWDKIFETIDRSRYAATTKRTWKSWGEQILNYFKNNTTNGFTEGCHTKIKMMKRVSFGFRNINNYIAKMMLAFVPLISVANYLLIHHTN